MNANVTLLTRCISAILALIASPVLAAGLSHSSQVPILLALPGQATGGGVDVRKQCEQLVKQARAALSQNRLDDAERLVAQAEKLGVKYDPFTAKLSDTPDKVRRDLTAARGPAASSNKGAMRLPSLLGGDPGKNNSPPPTDPFAKRASAENAMNQMTDDAKGRAKQALENGRQALAAGNVVEAQASWQKAVGIKTQWNPGEYTPDMLAADLERAGVKLPAPNREPAASPFTLRPSDLAKESDARFPTSKNPNSPSQVGNAFGPTDINPNEIPADRNPLTKPSSKNGGDFPGGDLMAANPVAQRLPGVQNAAESGPQRLPTVSAEPAGRKEEANRLLGLARNARQQGDLEGAMRLADQATKLGVPDEAFGPNEIKPWQLMLDVNKEMSQRAGVQRAAGVQDARGQFPVQQGGYDPRRDGGRVMPVQNESPLIAQPANSGNAAYADSLYKEGMQSLQNQDRAGAIAKFQEAWKFEKELDPALRQELKDKLSYLRNVPAPAPNANGPAPIEELSNEQQLRYQKYMREAAAERSAAEKLAQENPREALDNMKSLRDRVAQADLDPAGRKQILAIVDRSVKDLEKYLEVNRGDIELRESNNQVKEERARDNQMSIETQNKMAELVEQFNKLMEEGRYPEAEVKAKLARELQPNSSIAEMLTWKSRFAKSVAEQNSITSRKERKFNEQLTSVDQSSEGFDDRNPFVFGSAQQWTDLSKSRKKYLEELGRKLSPAEQEIEKSLGKQVEVSFEDRPLHEVLETLSKMANINIHLDPNGLHAEAVTPETPVRLKLINPISLKSALTMILSQLHLSYVIENEVLLITSQDKRDSHVNTKVYYVADLVTPIPNFVPSYNIGLPGAIRESFNAMGYGPRSGPMGLSSMPLTLGQNEANGQSDAPNSAMGQMQALAQMQGNAQMAMKDGSQFSPTPGGNTRTPQPLGYGPGGLGGGVIADFDTLIELITTTISPDSWTDNGGTGSISGFPTNLSLVVSQTQDIHADIADLLQQLRRLQDLQVTIEVRFITLNDNFFERVGVDFDFNIDDNTNLATSNAIPDDSGRSYVIGLSPNGQPTPNLDMQFTQNSFASAVPQFGGFDVTNAANFGFAILSDIEVFFLLQALQGDTRSNVLQAPKVTLFNGQQAFVRDSTDRPFVTQIIPVVGDFAAAHQPVVTVLSEGTSLSVQAVVSADRRFVRLTLVPFFTKIGNVETFTFSGKTTSNTGTTTVDPTDPTKKIVNGAQTTSEGTTVQLPSLAVTTVSTTVSVPDGGTVLLGGIKRLQEGRNERGVPLLSKIPYVSRLFKNVGIGRTTQSLMMMVTPRIIIQEEEEERLGLGIDQQ